jgi:hypothetical protein
MDFPEKMLVVLEIVVAEILVFFELSFGDQLNEAIPDNTGWDVQFAGQVVNGNKLHAAILPRKRGSLLTSVRGVYAAFRCVTRYDG